MDRKFGIEIEAYNVPMHTVANALNEAGIPTYVEGYNHARREHWKVVPDGSLAYLSQGFELVSPVLQGDEGLAAVEKVCAVLSRIGAKVARSCGFHVHIEARDLNGAQVRNVLKLYAKYEDCIDLLVAPSRRANLNHFSKSIRSATVRSSSSPALADVFARLDSAVATGEARGQDAVTALRYFFNGDRYMKVNLESFPRHGTLEFRQHNGTINAKKIVAWVLLMQGLVARATKTSKVKLDGAGSFERLVKLAPAKVRKTLRERRAILNAAAEEMAE